MPPQKSQLRNQVLAIYPITCPPKRKWKNPECTALPAG